MLFISNLDEGPLFMITFQQWVWSPNWDKMITKTFQLSSDWLEGHWWWCHYGKTRYFRENIITSL